MNPRLLSFLAGASISVLLLYAIFSRQSNAPPDPGDSSPIERAVGSPPSPGTPPPPNPSPPAETPPASRTKTLGRVSGRVVDAGSAPVAGAFAYLVAIDSPSVESATANATVRTEDDGRFEIAVDRDRVADLGVVHEGFAPVLVRDVAIRGDGTTDVGDVVLGTGASVSGRVIDTAGRPLDGVAVSARLVAETGESAPAPVGASGNVALPGRASLALRPVETRSREGGSFEIRGLAAGSTYRVAALPERAADSPEGEKTVVAPAGHVDLVVALSGIVIVRVIDARTSEPVGGARVRVEGENGSGEWRFPDWRKDPVRFDHGFPPGEYEATASARGYGSATERFEIGSVETPVEVTVRLEPEDAAALGALRVRASDSAGAPLPHLCVAIRAGAFLAEANPGRERPAETGVREIANVPPGRYEIIVTSQSRDFGRFASEVDIVAGETTEVEVVVPRAARLAVDVRDESGADVAGYTIDVRDAAGRRIEAEIAVPAGFGRALGVEPGTTVRYPGRLAIARVPEGAVTLVFGGDGFEALDRTVTAKAGEETVVQVTLRRTR